MKEKRIKMELARFEKLLQREARRLAREMEGYFELMEYGF